jgi:hypothetical protein
MTQHARNTSHFLWSLYAQVSHTRIHIRLISYLLQGSSYSASQVPLNNHSIAQITLEWDQRCRQCNTSTLLYPITTEYRQQTFPDVLSSIGGLLAALQGIHILLFGQPLLWGIFGM